MDSNCVAVKSHGHVLNPLTGNYHRIDIALAYFLDDPHAVTLELDTDENGVITWVFGRELFETALTEGFSGRGDVQLDVLAEGFCVTLSTPAGSAVIMLHQEDVEEFHTRLPSVPEIELDWDEFLKDLTEGF